MNDHKFTHGTGLIAWFSRNHVAANIIMLALLIGGVINVSKMRTEVFPSISPNLITVFVPYPGSTPFEIADSVTNRIEESLIGIDGVKRITATANEGSGTVFVEIEDFADEDDVLSEVENNVNSISDFPPEDAERPIITKIKVTPQIMSLAIHGNASEESIKYWAERIEEELKELSHVSLTSIRGIRDYEISINVSEENLRKYNLSFAQIGNAIQRFSIDIPAGTIESKREDITLRIQDKRTTAKEFGEISIITLEDGSTLYLKNIATIIDGFEDKNLISKFNGERAAFIDISRNKSEDTLTIATQVKDYLKTVSPPDGISISIQKDETVPLKERISLMLRNGIIGFMLVFLVLLLFLDLKLAFWTSAAIPISFMGGIMIISYLGHSINMVSLFALIVVLGIVVDDAIITGESIFNHQENNKGDKNATIKGVYAVMAPVTIGVATTMAAFAPLIFSTGVLGQIIKVIPVVVISILFISLFEAFFILPAHLSSPNLWSKGIMEKVRDRISKALSSYIDNIVIPFARIYISFRYATIAFFIGIIIVTSAMVSSGTVRWIFFPQIEADEVTINVTMPVGSPFALTQKTMLDIEKIAKDTSKDITHNDINPFKSLSLSIGAMASSGNHTKSSNNNISSNIGQLRIELVSSDDRTKSSGEIESLIRKKVELLPNIEELAFISSLIGEEADIEIELSHDDENILNTATNYLKDQIKQINGTKEVADSFEIGKLEYVFELTSQGLSTGITPADLGRQLRSAYFGLEVQRFQRGSSEIITYVRYPENERNDTSSLERSRIRLPNGTEVPLSTIATIKKQHGFSQIQTVNGKRVVTVTGDVDYDMTTPAEVINKLTNTTLPELEKQFQGLTYSFEGESKEQKADLKSLASNMVIALMIMYVLLGSILRSYTQPLIIMSAIPFGIVGAIWGHHLLGHDISFISLFGMIALSGVVVNDSVVLMDFFNKQRLEGHNSYDSILAAIKRRFRPILLTTLTTSVGLLPMLMETSLQAQFLIPMVISLAAGLVFSTFVILILIPCLIMVIRDFQLIGAKAKEIIGFSS